jgi:hypothetical protein
MLRFESEVHMPKLIRLYITHCAIGFGIAFVFVCALVALDVANLRHLILTSDQGLLAFVILVMMNGVVFAGVQFGIAVMRMADPEDGPKGGTRAPVTHLRPIRLEAQARR